MSVRTTTEQPEYRYCRLRVAVELHGKGPQLLDENETKALERETRRTFDLEQRILATAEALDVVVADSALNDAVAAMEARYEDPAQMAAELASNGLTPEDLRRGLAWQLRVEGVMERIAAGAGEVDEVEAELFYRMHPERFQRPETRTVRHILITINDDFPENRREAAEARARKLAAELNGRSEAFGETAVKNSECPSALHEGLIGSVPRGKLYPELDRALFAMEEGSLSGVLESEAGFHILWCERVIPAGTVPLDEALPKILEKLTERRRRNAQKEWLAGLAAKDAA